MKRQYGAPSVIEEKMAASVPQPEEKPDVDVTGTQKDVDGGIFFCHDISM